MNAAAGAARRVAVVIGGEADIGPACALLLADRGHHVIYAGADPTPTCEDVVRAGGEATAVPVDLDDPAGSAAAVAGAVSAWPAVHALVNCHFWLCRARAVEVTLEDWERSLRINLTGPLMATQALLTRLAAARGAAVVHLGSVDGALGNPTVAGYSAAKGGLVPLTHILAHDLASHRVRVNCVARRGIESRPRRR